MERQWARTMKRKLAKRNRKCQETVSMSSKPQKWGRRGSKAVIQFSSFRVAKWTDLGIILETKRNGQGSHTHMSPSVLYSSESPSRNSVHQSSVREGGPRGHGSHGNSWRCRKRHSLQGWRERKNPGEILNVVTLLNMSSIVSFI